ncbi:CPBP family intramembrane metalloprotease [Oscillatoria sp. FACHB-1407]|uniref:CPBP family intramembrane glutamic endopeptidase n=1 Tax=Oscillatoria sp. FACHB-1407 TaxID=2692847 RepID=UPI00168464A5|nr:type II CAAX endopeptidase family protein [Oscillatoria sp. FACHB-1407]MBD2464801.1 CPBP family intramembrane metalloprotease [Oscillatoria sp. FACHB-1407]
MQDSSPLSASTKPKPWGLWATLGFSLVVLGVFLVTQTLVFLAFLSFKISQEPALSPDMVAGGLQNNGFVLAIATLISAPICIAVIVGIIKLRKRPTIYEYLGLKRPSKRQLAEWCLIAILCIVALDLLKSFVDVPVIPPFVMEAYETAYFLPLFYFAIIVMAPLFEEVFFRGFLFQGLRHSSLKVGGAIVLPSAFWAMIHVQYDWLDIGIIFILGLLLGYARYRTTSLYVPLAMHALNNLLALLQVAWIVHFS